MLLSWGQKSLLIVFLIALCDEKFCPKRRKVCLCVAKQIVPAMTLQKCLIFSASSCVPQAFDTHESFQ